MYSKQTFTVEKVCSDTEILFLSSDRMNQNHLYLWIKICNKTGVCCYKKGNVYLQCALCVSLCSLHLSKQTCIWLKVWTPKVTTQLKHVPESIRLMIPQNDCISRSLEKLKFSERTVRIVRLIYKSSTMAQHCGPAACFLWHIKIAKSSEQHVFISDLLWQYVSQVTSFITEQYFFCGSAYTFLIESLTNESITMSQLTGNRSITWMERTCRD